MADPAHRPLLPPPPEAEQVMADLFARHAVVFDAQGGSADRCTACGPLRGMSIFEHQAAVLRVRLTHLGLMSAGEPHVRVM